MRLQPEHAVQKEYYSISASSITGEKRFLSLRRSGDRSFKVKMNLPAETFLASAQGEKGSEKESTIFENFATVLPLFDHVQRKGIEHNDHERYM